MINVGIIGAGRIGQVHARSILTGVPEARILAIADPYMKPAVAEWAKSVGIEGVYTDHRKILDDERIDAVLICASTTLHAQLSLEAIAPWRTPKTSNPPWWPSSPRPRGSL